MSNLPSKLPKAQKFNYWDSSNSAPSEIINRACDMVGKFGGQVTRKGMLAEADAKGVLRGAAALSFVIDKDGQRNEFRMLWPVLPYGEEKYRLRAERQAASMLFNDVKSRLVNIRIFGIRRAFFEYLVTPDGKYTMGQLADPQLEVYLPKLLT